MAAVAALGAGLLVAPGAAQSAEFAATAPPPIVVASTARDGAHLGGNGVSSEVDMTPDGAYQVFTSSSTDLVSTPVPSGTTQVYLRDTAFGSVRLISQSPLGGRGGNGPSTRPAVSDDGQTIAFLSSASDLVDGYSAPGVQAYVWSRATGLIRQAFSSEFPPNAWVTDLDLSGDGKTVSLVTSATNLTSIPTYNKPQVYRAVVNGTGAELISVGDTGTASVGGSSEPSISKDGSVVAFTAIDLQVDGSVPRGRQVVRYASGETPRMKAVSRVDGRFANGESFEPGISADGEGVAFTSTSTDLTSEALDGRRQVFHRDMRSSRVRLVSSTPHRGGVASGESYSPSMGADGVRIGFVSTATDLVPGADGTPQVYVGDSYTARIWLASRGTTGVLADREPDHPVIDARGMSVAFESTATSLVPGATGRQVFLASGYSRGKVERIGGADRYEVSAAISARTFPPGVPVVYVASGEGYADALSGSAMAGAQSGPVLLTRKGAVPASILRELQRLKPARIVVLGGLNTVDDAVLSILTPMAAKVERVAGADRYETSVLVSASWNRTGPTYIGQQAYIASGENFPDALAGSAAAGAHRAPVLLTRRDTIEASLVGEITRIKAEDVVVLGGTNSISDSFVEGFGVIKPTRRIGGQDRYAVAASVVNELPAVNTTAELFIASGETYPDALSAGAAAVQSGSPVLLVTKTTIPDSVRAALARYSPTSITVLGGTNTVSDAVLADLEQYLKR
ncbi:hypothetical protein GCM10009851_23880 [Herbiconiux moechotypicola]|uniref:Cell wall-binding repeat-containing protein n=1 Tax=Herbiconiux moechotypicola TaxID=637393 RepID=A0ABN3DPC1_9MICO